MNDLALSIAGVGLPHPLLVIAARAAIAAGDAGSAEAEANKLRRSLLGPAINATGVLLHTNLGRAPLGSIGQAPHEWDRGAGYHRGKLPGRGQTERAPLGGIPGGGADTSTGGADAGSDSAGGSGRVSAGDASGERTGAGSAEGEVGEAPTRFSNLEFDLTTGRRGSRTSHVSLLFANLTGAEAALVVNNCAAAVTLVLAALARDRGVAVSRGELVEIGGGFRVPEVMAQSGARLVEVGTTNRTRASDYSNAVAREDIALLLKVHPSNYRITGFTEEAGVADLASVGPPVVVDLGSGLLDERCPWLGERPDWLASEPGARQTLEAGAALVTFSGDKLLGGPQAGIICGRADLVETCAAHPLMRAFRPGSLVLGALQDVAMAYLRRDADAIPFWRMARVSVAELRARAEALGVGRPADTTALAGAGSLPGQEIASAGIELDGDYTAALRAFDPPVVARVNEQTTVIDLRTVSPADDELVAAAVRNALDT